MNFICQKLNDARGIIYVVCEIFINSEPMCLEDKKFKLMDYDDVETIGHIGNYIAETVKIRGKLQEPFFHISE